MRVRAAVLREMGLPAPYAESRPLEVTELELATPPGPGQALVRVRAAGLCHSDLSVIDGSRPRGMPMVLGHEAAGEVVELGPGTDGLAVGDHVVCAFIPSCGRCGYCAQGRPALCEVGNAANIAGTLMTGERRWSEPDGGEVNHHIGVSAFADHTVVAEGSLVRVDPDLTFAVAAVLGCAVQTGVGAVIHSAGVRPGDHVAVWGAGGVGLAAVLGACLAGAASIVVVDLVDAKLRLARDLGATATVPAADGAIAEVRRLTGGGADKAIETVGSERALGDAYDATRAGGTTVTVGLPRPDARLAISPTALVAQERTLRGSYMGSCRPAVDIPRFAELHAAGRLPVERLITHELELDEINEGFDRLRTGEAVRQVVLL